MADSGSWQPPGDPPPPSPPPSPPPGWGAPPPPPPGYQAYPPPPPAYGYSPPRPVDAFGRQYAEWWKRLVAALIDGLIIGIPLAILGFIIIIGTRTTDSFGTRHVSAGARGLAYLVQMGGSMLYFAIFDGSTTGQTPGKMAMRIQVRDATNGGPIGFGRALLRRFVYHVLFLACVIPGIINGLSPLWDSRRQAWHDKVANSVVVDVPSPG